MSKERLEEIKQKYNIENAVKFVDSRLINPNDLVWLIEQAERVQELTKLVNYHKEQQKKAEDKNEPYRHQNKRYREVLERISKHDAYEIDIFVAGKMADEALEGDPHESS